MVGDRYLEFSHKSAPLKKPAIEKNSTVSDSKSNPLII
jgi:hypothetical protein